MDNEKEKLDEKKLEENVDNNELDENLDESIMNVSSETESKSNDSESVNAESGEDDANVGEKSKQAPKDKSSQRWILLLLTVLIIVLVIVLFSLAYAKYVTSKQGNATAKVGNMICKMEVTACNQEDKSIVNPYCDVTVKSFNEKNGDKETTDTSINYKIKVVPTNNGNEVPKYYWEKINEENTEGTKNEIVAGTAEGKNVDGKPDLEGTFTKGDSTEQKYKIVFVNTGETDVTKSVQFQLTATQADGTKKQ